MEIKIPIQFSEKFLNVTIETTAVSNDWVLFLSGGSLKQGRSRYWGWQEKLKENGINSMSFDYSGVESSGIELEESSLEQRISEATQVLQWIKQKHGGGTVSVFGASMGGYIALGLINQNQTLVDCLILFAPAAYNRRAHSLKFGGSFTNEIRQVNSWQDSMAYDWLRDVSVPTLFIRPDNDSIIPEGVCDIYQEIGARKNNFTKMTIEGCHSCWGLDESETRQREEVFKLMEQFILDN